MNEKIRAEVLIDALTAKVADLERRIGIYREEILTLEHNNELLGKKLNSIRNTLVRTADDIAREL